eukprot:15483443-Alexandrium_andersonii.AAC.1
MASTLVPEAPDGRIMRHCSGRFRIRQRTWEPKRLATANARTGNLQSTIRESAQPLGIDALREPRQTPSANQG